MNENIKMICFDMDGTIADLYGVENWLEDLQKESFMPYWLAQPMWNMTDLAEVLTALQAKGIEVRVITWLAQGASENYKMFIRWTKLAWLYKYGFPHDNFHGVQYGATKADSVRKYLRENETAILIDDNAKVRSGWHLGETVDPQTTNIVEFLNELL